MKSEFGIERGEREERERRERERGEERERRLLKRNRIAIQFKLEKGDK
jgi:hypothetical protein